VKAVLCREYGPPATLTVEEVPPLTAGAGQVIVSVKAAGVNFPDLLIIQNKYQVKPALPFSPGGEVAGVVKEVGGGVTHLAPGDRVMAITTYGGFAEEACAQASRVVLMPEVMDFATAAAFGLTYGTADHALADRAAIASGETLLVLGAAGGVGIAAVEIGKALGARVIACASSAGKIAVCREHGADEAINYAAEDLRERIKELTAGRGVDVVLDPVGGMYSEPALRSLAWRGRLLVVGFAAGEIPRIPLNLTLLKGCSIVGVFWGDFTRREPARFAERMRHLCRWYEEGKLRPHISLALPLERAAEALSLMSARRAVGKMVLTPPSRTSGR
jgi:NADPH2:quinone reductase